jgi:hypothetical protein
LNPPKLSRGLLDCDFEVIPMASLTADIAAVAG